MTLRLRPQLILPALVLSGLFSIFPAAPAAARDRSWPLTPMLAGHRVGLARRRPWPTLRPPSGSWAWSLPAQGEASSSPFP
jgi:hypothetical protein